MLTLSVPKSVLAFHCYKINDHKERSLRQHPLIISQFLRIRSPGGLKWVYVFKAEIKMCTDCVFLRNSRSSSRLILVIGGILFSAVIGTEIPISLMALSLGSCSALCGHSPKTAMVHQILQTGVFYFHLVYNLWI